MTSFTLEFFIYSDWCYSRHDYCLNLVFYHGQNGLEGEVVSETGMWKIFMIPISSYRKWNIVIWLVLMRSSGSTASTQEQCHTLLYGYARLNTTALHPAAITHCAQLNFALMGRKSDFALSYELRKLSSEKSLRQWLFCWRQCDSIGLRGTKEWRESL